MGLCIRFSIKTVGFQVSGPLNSLHCLSFFLFSSWHSILIFQELSSCKIFAEPPYPPPELISFSLLSSTIFCFCTFSRMASWPGTCPHLQLDLELFEDSCVPCLHHPTQCRHQMHPLFLVTAISHLKILG